MVEKYGVPDAEVAKIFKIFVESHDREMHYSDFLAAMACDQIELDGDLLFTTFQKFDTRAMLRPFSFLPFSVSFVLFSPSLFIS